MHEMGGTPAWNTTMEGLNPQQLHERYRFVIHGFVLMQNQHQLMVQRATWSCWSAVLVGYSPSLRTHSRTVAWLFGCDHALRFIGRKDHQFGIHHAGMGMSQVKNNLSVVCVRDHILMEIAPWGG